MSDPALTLDRVRPLVAQQRVVGRTLEVTFRCPVTRQEAVGRWTAPPGPQAHTEPRPALAEEVRDQAAKLMIRVLGSGSLGRAASRSVHRALTPSPRLPTLTVDEQKLGLIQAFARVMHTFAWQREPRRWVHAAAAPDLLGPLERQLYFHALRTVYDRILVARMLVEVAAVDGPLGEEELGYLQDALDPAAGSLQALQARPALTPADMAQATPGPPRVTMLTLVHVIARVDGHLASAETSKIDTFASGLQLDGQERARSRGLAEGWLLDQALERMTSWGGHDGHARAELESLGRRLGIAPSKIAEAEARFLRGR